MTASGSSQSRPLPPSILVTGAGGFIGGRVAQLLAQQSGVVEVRKTGRRPDPKRQVTCLRLDNEADVQKALAGCGVVVHCAFNMYDMASNVKIADVLGRACAKAGIRLVHISTAAVYEPLPDGNLDELFPMHRTDSYSATKAAIEDLLSGYATTRGLDLVILQPTIVYGPAGRAWTDSPVGELLFGPVVLPNEGKGLCNAVFVDDVCQAVINAIKADIPSGERLLISGPSSVEWREFFQSYANMLGRCNLVLQPMSLAEADGHDEGQRISKRDRFAGKIKAMIVGRLSASTRGRLNMVFRRVRSAIGKNRIASPKGATLALYSARCDIRIDKARNLLDYLPAFDLQRGMAMTEGYVKRKYFKQIARCGHLAGRVARGNSGS
ncbi:MAG: oxidoreductase [Rhodospirillales bacterium]|nr:oxidoreductase [Rhodospirillales bacterium]